MRIKAIPTRIVETRSGRGEETHCSWEVQLYDDDSNTVYDVIVVDLMIANIKSSKLAYNNHLRAQIVASVKPIFPTFTTSDVIIL